MPEPRNMTITAGGTAQNLLAAFHGWGGFILTPLTEDMWLRFDGDAAVDAGEKIFLNAPAKFSADNFPAFNARVSIVSATTGAKFTVRPTSG